MKTQQQIIEEITNKINEPLSNVNYTIRVEDYKTTTKFHWVYIQTNLLWINLTTLNDIATRVQDDAISVTNNQEGIKLLITVEE